jgi:adenosylhomocysteine nucleosidase
MVDEPRRRVAVLAAMKPELKPFVRRLSLERGSLGDLVVYRGRVGDSEVVSTVTSMGIVAAADVTERLLDRCEVDEVLVIGIAGGIGPDVEIGDLVVPEAVIHGNTGVEYTPAPLYGLEPSGKLVTTDGLVEDVDRQAEFVRRGAHAVDMETAAIAQVCEARGCRWSVVRAISDRANADHVDDAVFGLAKPDGSGDPAAVAKFLVTRPHRIPQLVELGRNMHVAVDASVSSAIDQLKR